MFSLMKLVEKLVSSQVDPLQTLLCVTSIDLSSRKRNSTQSYLQSILMLFLQQSFNHFIYFQGQEHLACGFVGRELFGFSVQCLVILYNDYNKII